MGSMFCCIRDNDSQANEESSTDEHCKFFNFCILFKVVTSPATAPADNALPDNTIRPQEATPNSHQLQSRQDDSSATKAIIDHSHERSGSNPLARNDDGRVGLNVSPYGAETQVSDVKPSVIEEEEVCPICLEDFIRDNPNTCLQCSHGYHLACILNWLERSPVCPMCDAVILFEES